MAGQDVVDSRGRRVGSFQTHFDEILHSGLGSFVGVLSSCQVFSKLEERLRRHVGSSYGGESC